LQRDRSYVRLQVCVEPEEDFHLFDQARSQTHWIPAFAGVTAGGASFRGNDCELQPPLRSRLKATTC
jgi:hypothetical protein